MQPTALFWLTFAPMGLAAVVALTGDMIGGRASRAGVLGAAVLLAGSATVGLISGYAFPTAGVYSQFVVGGGWSMAAGLIALLGAATLFVRADSDGAPKAQDAALIALAAAGSALAAVSTTLLTLALSLETAAVCGYALVARGRTRRASEAAMKYLVQGTVATGTLFLGYALFLPLGSASGAYSTLGAVAGRAPVASILGASVLVIAAFAFKIGAAPFHSWAPDAYETAPPPAAAFLAGAGKLAAVLALSSFLVGVTSAIPGKGGAADAAGTTIVPVLAMLAILSVLIGSLLALRQRSYTRMLGYAGVAQAGYALIAASALNPTAALVFTTTYAIGTSCAFIAAGEFRRVLPEWDGSIEGLAGVGRKSPGLGAVVTMAMVSLAGIPPLLGFWGKFHAFGAAVYAAAGWLLLGQLALGVLYIVLVVCGLVGSVVSVAYYGSVIRAMYFESAPVAAGVGESEAPGANRSSAVVFVLGAVLLLTGLVPLLLDFSTALKGFVLGG